MFLILIWKRTAIIIIGKNHCYMTSKFIFCSGHSSVVRMFFSLFKTYMHKTGWKNHAGFSDKFAIELQSFKRNSIHSLANTRKKKQTRHLIWLTVMILVSNKSTWNDSIQINPPLTDNNMKHKNLSSIIHQKVFQTNTKQTIHSVNLSYSLLISGTYNFPQEVLGHMLHVKCVKYYHYDQFHHCFIISN